jgi:hypothetical protein
MKARGFKKCGRTFSCERTGYIEMLGIQGSSWNSGDEPWIFYVNVDVRFTDLPLESAAAGAKYHASGRLERIVGAAPPQYELTRDNLSQTVALVARLAEASSDRLPELLPVVRDRACRGFYSCIPYHP